MTESRGFLVMVAHSLARHEQAEACEAFLQWQGKLHDGIREAVLPEGGTKIATYSFLSMANAAKFRKRIEQEKEKLGVLSAQARER